MPSFAAKFILSPNVYRETYLVNDYMVGDFVVVQMYLAKKEGGGGYILLVLV